VGDSQVSTELAVVDPVGGADPGHDCVVVLYPPDGPHYGRRIALAEQLSIGRDPINDLVLPATCVSRQHCRLECSAGAWRVVELGSKNGTRVAGRDVVDSAPLSSGTEIKVGDTILKFLAGTDVEAQFLEAVHRLAVEDPLTGLDNRRAFSQALARELQRARRYRRPLSVVVLDVDGFKAVNEDVGHVVADVLLQLLASVLRDRIRSGDILARIGGEELALLLPETDLAAARRVAEDLRARVADHVFETRRGVVPLTISAGVAELGPDTDAEQFLEAADRRLFEAKRAGRNRIG
jgi:diguanylate cyclase (GGDEF)-like protein